MVNECRNFPDLNERIELVSINRKPSASAQIDLSAFSLDEARLPFNFKDCSL